MKIRRDTYKKKTIKSVSLDTPREALLDTQIEIFKLNANKDWLVKTFHLS